jgi:hypothetical protein
LIDRFDLIFVLRNIRNEEWLRNYASKKLDQHNRRIANYTRYLRKYIEYCKRFNPKLSGDAEHMLREYYVNVGLQYGSPRLLESITIIAKMIARLKLKNFVDPEDAYEAQQFYNVILQQLQQMVNIVTDPSDEAYNACLEILRGFIGAIQFDELIKMACDRNLRVRNYIGDKHKLRENSKLRPILEKLRNHSQVNTISEKPIVLKWNNGDELPANEGGTCDVCDACDEDHSALNSETSSYDTINDIVMTPEAPSHTSHATHRGNNPIEESPISQQPNPRNTGRIHRTAPHSDTWVCEDCNVKGDRWFVVDHNCKKYVPGDSETVK